MSEEIRCPRCGSTRVRSDHTHMEAATYGRECTAWEMACLDCKLYEIKDSDEPDFKEWFARWTAPGPT